MLTLYRRPTWSCCNITKSWPTIILGIEGAHMLEQLKPLACENKSSLIVLAIHGFTLRLMCMIFLQFLCNFFFTFRPLFHRFRTPLWEVVSSLACVHTFLFFRYIHNRQSMRWLTTPPTLNGCNKWGVFVPPYCSTKATWPLLGACKPHSQFLVFLISSSVSSTSFTDPRLLLLQPIHILTCLFYLV